MPGRSGAALELMTLGHAEIMVSVQEQPQRLSQSYHNDLLLLVKFLTGPADSLKLLLSKVLCWPPLSIDQILLSAGGKIATAGFVFCLFNSSWPEQVTHVIQVQGHMPA